MVTFLKKITLSALLTASALAAPAFAEAPASTTPAAAEQKVEQSLTRISINSADAATLAQHLVGIGPSKAEAIIAWRSTNGRFTDTKQLLEIKGIGQATLEKNKTRITL